MDDGKVDKAVRKMSEDEKGTNDGCKDIVGEDIDEKGDGRKDIQDGQFAKPGFVLMFHFKASC